MNKVIAGAGTALTAILGLALLAPSAWAMALPVEPGGGTPASTGGSSVSGIAVWQVIAIALVAVAIGAVGSFLAQRTYRRSHVDSVSMA